MKNIMLSNAVHDLKYATKNIELVNDITNTERELLEYRYILWFCNYRSYSVKTALNEEAVTAYVDMSRFRPEKHYLGIISGTVEAKYKDYAKIDKSLHRDVSVAKSMYITHTSTTWQKYIDKAR